MFNVKYGTDLVLLMDVSALEDGSEYKAVAHATSHSLEFLRNIREISSKSTKDYVGSAYGKAKWSISVDGLISYDTEICNYDTLMAYIIAKRKVKIISLAQLETSTLQDDTGVNEAAAKAQGDANSKYYKGDCVIASVNKTAGDEDNASFSVALNGASELTPIAVTTTYLVTITVENAGETIYGEYIFIEELKKYVACDAAGVATFLAPDLVYNIAGINSTEEPALTGHKQVTVAGAPKTDNIVIA